MEGWKVRSVDRNKLIEGIGILDVRNFQACNVSTLLMVHNYMEEARLTFQSFNSVSNFNKKEILNYG